MSKYKLLWGIFYLKLKYDTNFIHSVIQKFYSYYDTLCKIVTLKHFFARMNSAKFIKFHRFAKFLQRNSHFSNLWFAKISSLKILMCVARILNFLDQAVEIIWSYSLSWESFVRLFLWFAISNPLHVFPSPQWYTENLQCDPENVVIWP